ncbi:MAG: hypothetical protein HOP30_14130, partial [Cyclobacteriaceae bacterium]|nr:hypothetical protein [Cyclobacteriaceae bacterium]
MQHTFAFVLLIAFTLLSSTESLGQQKRKKEKQYIELDKAKDSPRIENYFNDDKLNLLGSLTNEFGTISIGKRWSEDVVTVYQKRVNETLFGLLRISTKTLITPFVFNFIDDVSIQNNIAIVSINGYYGAFDTRGELVIPCIYESMNYLPRMDRVLFTVSKNGQYGIIDSSNKILLPFVFNQIKRFGDFNVVVSREGKHGIMSLMSLSDNVELTWDDVTLYGLDMLIVRKESLYNLVSPQVELISPQWYSQLTFSGSSKPLIARLDGKYGLIDKAGRVLLR